MSNTDYTLYTKTPKVMVLDNRGEIVREIGYHRHPDTPQATDVRITRHQFNALGQLLQSIDPRLFDLQQADATVKPNFTYFHSLTGKVSRTDSVDAGVTLSLDDIIQRPVLSVNATNVIRTWQYEDSALPGRLLSITERPEGGESQITERFVWAGNSPSDQAQNLSGNYIRHYDIAGLNLTNSIALTSLPLSISRQLLKDDASADWPGNDESVWRARLSPEVFTTTATFDATGTLLTQTDAKKNTQRMAYDVAGLLCGSWLTLKGQSEQIILKSQTYSAAGQKLREEHGNGVVTIYRYETETQRLIGIKTERPAGHSAGAKVFQDLRYDYDPIGNVLSVSNDAEATRFWRNQKVGAINTYTYDSLYQLVVATGRELANIAQQSTSLPNPIIPLPTDNNSYTNYTRSYTYDEGGNLAKIRQSATANKNSYTINITVSNRSNRAVLDTLTKDPAQVDALFDKGGHQLQFLPGQPLIWTDRGALQQVTPVSRDDQLDKETYRYNADSQRIVKVSTQQTGNGTLIQQVIYLPGLELRTMHSGSTLTESLHTIAVGEAGRAQVRVLHWETGQPQGIDENNQLRYSYDNLIGSSGLEIDGKGCVISLEEYYPYGGTSVWAARKAIEASYKTIRYSGKERDATGLYYYGYRYYQPWVGRWLSVDPAETVDGLNLFKMVSNNPVTFKDGQGLYTILDVLHIDQPDTAKVAAAYQRQLSSTMTTFQNKTDLILTESQKTAKEKSPGMKQFSKNSLQNFAAHAGYFHNDSYQDLYVNFKDKNQNLAPGKLFPGVELLPQKTIAITKPEGGWKNALSIKIAREFEDSTAKKYRVKFKVKDEKKDISEFITGVKDMYKQGKQVLHPMIQRLIKEHVEHNDYVLPTMAGIAGLHAEVQALNKIFIESDEVSGQAADPLNPARYARAMLQSSIFTKRLTTDKAGQDFPACHNCSGIIRSPANVITGMVESAGSNFAAQHPTRHRSLSFSQ
ncbi:RHS repeat-associated core domain-containing protein [Xenorhabdus bovienii]|uniref:RHS repeat-associated core domain-containing protein n=1 Tax=Xenorhabdus bovienii TaxID=40576 RepID=UPI003DA3ABA5